MRMSLFSQAVRPAVALLAAVALAGCMQTDTKTTILADGSGTCSDLVVIDVQKSKDIGEMGKMLGLVPPNIDFEKALDATFGEATLKAQLAANPGVAVKSVTSVKANGKITAKREFAFADFSTLNALVFWTSSAEMRKNDDGSYTLDMDAIGMFRGMLGGGGGADSPLGGMDLGAMIEGIAEQLGDLRVTRAFTMPGTVVETNGTKGEDGKTVTWAFALADLKKAGGDMAKAPGKMTVTFKGDGLMLKPFRFAPRFEDLSKGVNPSPTPAGPTTPSEPAKPPEPTKPVEPPPSAPTPK